MSSIPKVEEEIAELESQLTVKRQRLKQLQSNPTFSDTEEPYEDEFHTDSRWRKQDKIQIKIDGHDRVVTYDPKKSVYKWRNKEYKLSQVRKMHPKTYRYKKK